MSAIYLNTSYIDSDTIKIKLNDNLKVESLPSKNIFIESEFGNFNSEISLMQEDNSIQIIQSLYINKGTYPKEKYLESCDFFEKISEHYNSKIIIKKE